MVWEPEFDKKPAMFPENVLEEATRLVTGDRQEAYLHPFNDYYATAQMWQALILKRYKVEIPLTPDFCCLMMSALKLSREAGKHKRDNLVDAAGYVLCASMCLDEPMNKEKEDV